MTGAERGYLLLCGELADGEKPLTPAQLRTLRRAVRQSDPGPFDPDRALTAEDLCRAGLRAEAAERIIALLGRDRALDSYLETARLFEIFPLTAVSEPYPARLTQRLGEDAPAVLFGRGNLSLLQRPAVSLTGSRDPDADSVRFARQVGTLAAREGWVLVSGNARGADRCAMDACLEAGGAVIAFVPGELETCCPRTDRELYLCESGWHLAFTAWGALARNRLIYALSRHALIACTGTHGGTFSGASEALRRGNGPVSVRDDGGPGSRELISLGAHPVSELTTLAPPPALQSVLGAASQMEEDAQDFPL